MNNKKLLFWLLLLGSAVQAQEVSNTGVIFIHPNTVMSVMSGFNNHPAGTLWNDGELLLQGDFNNDGLVSFTPLLPVNGFTRFEGRFKQMITGNEISEFQNVLFNNTSSQPAIELYSEISVAGRVDFTRGIVNSKDFGGLIVFERIATEINTNNNSFIDGPIKKNGDQAFIFPVGNQGNFRHSAIAATNDVLSSFTANYFMNNSDLLYPHSQRDSGIEMINNQEYWVLEKNGGNADAMLTLSWDDSTTTPPDVVITPEESLHIVRWDVAQNLWIDEGGVVNLSDRTITTAVSVSGYGIFTLAKMFTNLPCKELIVYNAISPNGDGSNDYLRIDGLDSCTEGANSVQIFNRWGVKVFETDNYGQNGNVFDGYANARSTIAGNKLLPSGTYFYVLSMSYKGSGNKTQTRKKSGYLYLN